MLDIIKQGSLQKDVDELLVPEEQSELVKGCMIYCSLNLFHYITFFYEEHLLSVSRDRTKNTTVRSQKE